MRRRIFTARAAVALIAWVAVLASRAPAQPEPARGDSRQSCSKRTLTDARFIGVVRCETAGNWVARFQVLETWRGCPASARLRIRSFSPVALVGEQFVIVVRDEFASARWIDQVPRTRNQLGADCAACLVPLPARREDVSFAFGCTDTDIAALRSEVIAFSALSPAEQDLQALWQATDLAHARPEIDPWQDDLFAKVRSARTLHDAITRIAVESAPEQASAAHELTGSLRSRDALAELEAASAVDVSPLGRFLLRDIDDLRDWLSGAPRVELPRDCPPRNDSAKTSDLAALRASLARPRSSYQLTQTLIALAELDPAPAADFLVSNEDPRSGFENALEFARHCTGDRGRHLRRLTDANDPMTRVVGAVYLRFEDPVEGAARLRELTALDGDAGAWAALVLASHGDRDAVERALDVFDGRSTTDVRVSVRRNRDDLRYRLLALLSNSAHASGRELPPSIANALDSEAGWARVHAAAIEWWQANRDVVTPIDPWAPELDAKKVD